MALVLKKLITGYMWLANDVADPRANHFYFLTSPIYPIIFSILYVYFVLELGPKLMRNHPAFNLNKILIVFNAVQVITNAFIVYVAAIEIFHLDSWTCALIDYSETPHNYFILKIYYLYFFLKLADLFDTVFFILRKKEQQVSFLHVYHHLGMLNVAWAGLKFLGGGQTMFIGIVNCFVHSVMYFYYFLTIWNPRYKNNIWWKKHITNLQMIQFLFFIIMFVNMLLFEPDCQFPKIGAFFMIPQNLFMLCLFGDFYWKNYITTPKSQKILKDS